VLGVGIDWAEDFHLVALGQPEQGVIQTRRIEHTPGAVEALMAQIAALEPDPAQVRVVLETRHGLLVERLVDAGYVVLPVNPDLVARRRGPARKKDDAEDARICCLLALDRHAHLRPLIPTGSWPPSCVPSPATTSAPPVTSGGCSTGCATTSSPPSRPRCSSPLATWAPQPSSSCWSAGRPERHWPTPRARN
jgi:hypothetical protein